MLIRPEEARDHRAVEALTRRAFWNLHAPGCNEHYLVHKLRSHPDFIPELDFVLEVEGQIIGSIFYTKSRLINGLQEEKTILTFGPVAIDPQHQRKGYGRALIEHSFSKAIGLGYDYIVIFGKPSNYVGLGFKSCQRFNIHLGDGVYPTAMLVKQLGTDGLKGQAWRYQESDVYAIDEREAEAFDQGFEPMEKQEKAGQEEFYILSQSRIIPTAFPPGSPHD